MKPLTFNSYQWPGQNFSIQQHTINQISDENKVKYQFGDKLIQYQMLWTNILIIVWLTKENYKFNLAVKWSSYPAFISI